MKTPIYILLAVTIIAVTFMKIVSKKQQADLLVIHATVHTVNENNSTAEAIAIRGNRIVAVGSTQDIQNQYTSQNVIDAKGKTIVPGFIDSHAHVLGLGKALTELNLVGTTSPRQIAKMVADKVGQMKPGEWIRGRGWDQNDWRNGRDEKPFPTAAILDNAAPNNPVVLSRVDGHALWVNSKAMEIAASKSDLRIDVYGGKILRDRFGKPTGIFIDNAEALINSAVPDYSKSEKLQMYQRAFNECLKYGITSVHDMGIDKTDFEIYKGLSDTQSLPVRIYALIGGTGPFLTEMLNAGPFSDGLHYQLMLRSIKLYMDGALGSRGAALNEPYSDEPESPSVLRLSSPRSSSRWRG